MQFYKSVTFNDVINFPTGGTISGGGANRILYENGSQVLATSSNFTYDGRLTLRSTTEQQRWEYDASNYLSLDVSTGAGTANIRVRTGENIFFGHGAGNTTQTGVANVGFGRSALSGLTTGNRNIAIGYNALVTADIADDNIALGFTAAQSLTSGSGNFCLGKTSGYALTTGNSNVLVGSDSGRQLGSGSENICLGAGSGYNATGSGNVYIGFQSGLSNSTGAGNVFIGYQAGYNETGAGLLYISNTSTTTPLIYGDFTSKFLRLNATEVRQNYDGSNYLSTTISSVGVVTFDAVGSGAKVVFSDPVTVNGTNSSLTFETVDNTGAYKIRPGFSGVEFVTGAGAATAVVANALVDPSNGNNSISPNTSLWRSLSGIILEPGYGVGGAAVTNKYDGSNNGTWQVSSVGVNTFTATGASAKFVFANDVEVPDEAYDATAWNGSTEVPTKNAIRDKIESMSAGSGITRSVNNTSGSATMGSAASTDYVYFVTGAHTMSLPAASGNTNRYTVKNLHTTNITIDTVGAELIEGAASISIPPEAAVDIISNNTNWYVI